MSVKFHGHASYRYCVPAQLLSILKLETYLYVNDAATSDSLVDGLVNEQA